MGDVTLDDRDRAVLERLLEGAAAVDDLAAAVPADAEHLRERLPELADNGLVDGDPGGGYRLTDDGARVVEAAGTGAQDDRIDTPPAVEGRVRAFDLPPDREAALRGAFAFLHYWGDATAAEIVDAVYSEAPAGFDDAPTWWRECVRDRLAVLPGVDPARSPGEQWRYEGVAIVDAGSRDGRDVAGAAVTEGTSARFALARLDLDPGERRAVRRVFSLLVELGEVSEPEATEQVYPDYDAGYGSPTEWWADGVRPALESLPGVERADGDRERWRYRTADVA